LWRQRGSPGRLLAAAQQSKMMAQRKTMPKLHMPCYDLEDVPVAARDLSSSVVVRLKERDDWMGCLSEMLLLCNEAAARRVAKFGPQKTSDGTQTKPLGLEYMADRLDTDDPLEGFQVRSSEGWLQGFITTTTFTVWQRAFRWDSFAPESGVADDDLEERNWDSDNALALELEQQHRAGNPDAEGIIWPKLAEISLLGALGCGTWLMKLVLEELEKEGEYEFVVVQATENSVPFYENFGFIRVGAVAKYREKTLAKAASKKGGAADKSNSKKRGGSERDNVETPLPDWLKNKRFNFFVGSAQGSSTCAATKQDFSIFVEKEWEVQRGFRLYERFCDSDGLMKLREWRCAKELEPFDAGKQRFVPHKIRTASKPFPQEQLYQIKVQHRTKDDTGKKASDYVEIFGEQEAVSAAYVQLNEAAAQPKNDKANTSGRCAPGKVPINLRTLKPGEIDWNDHSGINVARRRAAGFVPYCHWTFPNQSVEDVCPSYMMAKRLVKQPAPFGGALQTLHDKMQEELPQKKCTREAPPAVPVHTGHNFDDVSAETVKKSLCNKVGAPLRASKHMSVHCLRWVRGGETQPELLCATRIGLPFFLLKPLAPTRSPE